MYLYDKLISFLRLTTRESDAYFLLQSRLPGDRRLFNEQPEKRSMSYEFVCVTKDEQFIIEVDQRGDFEIRGTDVLIGAINLFFVRRLWDASLRLTSSAFIGGDYKSLAHGLAHNLKIIPAHQQGCFDISTMVSDREIRVKSCILKRMTVHSSILYPDLRLMLTENQEVEGLPPTTQNVFRGIIKPARQIVPWWEASLFSVVAAAILTENDTLELGQVAAWRPEDIVATGAIGDLVGLATAIVTRIDSIGLSNRGSKAESTAKVGSQTEQQSGELAAGLNYW